MPRVNLPYPATYADLEAIPDILVAEIIDHELWTSPRPALRHADASSGVIGLLKAPFQYGRGGPGGWHILHEPELHLGAHVLVPDVAGWRKARVPELPQKPFSSIAPDWICEVLSPSTEALDRGAKMRVYAEHGVDHAWMVDPVARTIEVHVRDGATWTRAATHAGSVTASLPPFEAQPFDVGLLWA